MQRFIRQDIPRPRVDIIREYTQFDVSTVYEAQGKVGLLGPSLRPLIPDSRVCGPAVTVTCCAGDNLMIHAAIEVCQPGDIVVVGTIGSKSECGMVGELIVRALMQRGVKGLVIDAGVRDARQIRDLGFPVWCRAVHPEGTTKTRAGWVNADVVCAGARISPGDIVLADDDGVVAVAQSDFEETRELTRRRMSREDGTKERIGRGELSVDFYGLRQVLKDQGVKWV